VRILNTVALKSFRPQLELHVPPAHASPSPSLVRAAIVLVGIIAGFLSHARALPSQAPQLQASSAGSQDIAQLQAQAQAGKAGAQFVLGRAYEQGNKVPRNDELAAKWYRAAAEQGDASAQNDLGLMLMSGRGVEKDKAEAVKWYKKAARQKNAAAMFNLGAAYYNGDGVAEDSVTAYAWFLLAKSSGSKVAVDAAKRMEAEPGRLEADAYERAADMLYAGEDLPQSQAEAVEWYRKAAEMGDADMQMKLANVLLQNRSASTDYAEVRNLCEKASRRSDSRGFYCVGLLYSKGLGVTQNFSQAAKWFTSAANLDNASAMLQLGEMYWKGMGVKQNKVSAYQFLTLASTFDLPDAKREKESLEKDLTPKQLKEGQTKAAQWARSHHPLVLL
jgi:uncharacterized protein